MSNSILYRSLLEVVRMLVEAGANVNSQVGTMIIPMLSSSIV